MLLLLFVVGCTSAAFCGQRRVIAAAPNTISPSSRYPVSNKPVSSCYEEHVRPFRITIDNPYEGLTNNIATCSPSHVDCPLHRHHSLNDRLSPRTSFEENDRIPHNLSNHASPVPSPRPSISAAVQTEGAGNNISGSNCITTEPGFGPTTGSGVVVPISVITPPTPEVALDRPARGISKQAGNKKETGCMNISTSSVTASSHLSPDLNPDLAYF